MIVIKLRRVFLLNRYYVLGTIVVDLDIIEVKVFSKISRVTCGYTVNCYCLIKL